MSGSTPPRRLFVGVGNTRSAHPEVKPLGRALDDVHQLAARLAELGLETVCVEDPANGFAAGERLKTELPHKSLAARGVLVLLWAGHAASHRTKPLALLTAGDENATGVTMDPATLADIAAASWASQVLILLDTCHSGDGALDALAVSSSAASSSPSRTVAGRAFSRRARRTSAPSTARSSRSCWPCCATDHAIGSCGYAGRHSKPACAAMTLSMRC